MHGSTLGRRGFLRLAGLAGLVTVVGAHHKPGHPRGPTPTTTTTLPSPSASVFATVFSASF